MLSFDGVLIYIQFCKQQRPAITVWNHKRGEKQIMSNELRERVDQLNTMIQDSKIMEAMDTFYADDVVMGENDNPPCEGLEANLAREQDFVDNTEWFGLELKDVSVGDGVTMVRWWMDFHNTHYGARMAFNQVAVQKWREGKIYDERYYYTPTTVED